MNPNDTIGEILGHKGSQVWSISPNATVFDAIQMMSDKNIGALLVIEGDRLVGIITERDYTRKVALKGKVSKQTAVNEILTGVVVKVTPESTVEECMRLMTDNRVRHLPVVEGEKILGVVSIGDLVNWTIERKEEEIQHLQHFIAGGYPG